MNDTNTITLAQRILPHYIEALIWCSCPFALEEGGEENEADSYDATFSPEDEKEALENIENFIHLAGADLIGLDEGMIGHDIALTQNHHGAGFWDRGYGAKGDRLTKHAHSLGSWQCVGVTPDGKYYYVEG